MLCQSHLSVEEQQSLFERHVEALREKCANQFKQLLDSLLPELPSSQMDFMVDIYPLVKQDIQFKRLLSTDSSNSGFEMDSKDGQFVKRLFQGYLTARLVKLEAEFKELLKEKKELLSYKFISAESNAQEGNPEDSVDLDDYTETANVHKTSSKASVELGDAVDLLSEDSRYLRMRVLGEEREAMVKVWLEDTRRECKRQKFSLKL